MDLALFGATAFAYRYYLSYNALSYALLARQDAATSNALISHYQTNDSFRKLAEYEGKLTVQRDEQDDDKLAEGIAFAQKKGVIPIISPAPYVTIDVLGKSPSQVAQTILKKLDGATTGVLVLVGLSGTGKGTTVCRLREILESEGRSVTTWSNGNVFRSVTLLAMTWCEQNDKSVEEALTKENLASFMSMLTFGKFNGKFDTQIKGLGMEHYVTEVSNTVLKTPIVSKNIPTVAGATQGEVILFAADAVTQMGKEGFVLLEGREQTVNYVETPHRFKLVLSDDSLIGQRRAAQRIMGAALCKVQEGDSSKAIQKAVDSVLKKMVNEIDS